MSSSKKIEFYEDIWKILDSRDQLISRLRDLWLSSIHSLNETESELQKAHGDLTQLNQSLKKSEIDSELRLEQIHTLTKWLEESQATQVDRDEKINDLIALVEKQKAKNLELQEQLELPLVRYSLFISNMITLILQKIFNKSH